jgi:hypothetical protein
VNSILLVVHGCMRVAAEDTIGAALTCVFQSSRGNLGRHPEPARVETVDEPHDGLAFEIKFLQRQIERCSELAEPDIIDLKTIELMAVDRDVAQSVVLPGIALVHADADQVRHDIGEAVVMIALDPDDFDVAFGIRKFANVAQELPVVFGEAGEVEIGKDVAQQNQPLKTVFFKHARRFSRVTGLCTEVQVGKDQRVVHGQIHN